LVHDDLPCFDDADTRRGKATVHKAFSQPLAVLTGDSLIVLAFDILAAAAQDGSHSDVQRALSMVRVLATRTGMPMGICAGQGWESETSIDLSAYHRAKTGALFIAATQMGAIAAGQEPDQWEELGARIGEAFQVADDLRDALYDADALGKPAGQDAIHARPNAVAELGVQGAVSRLQDILGGAISSIPRCQGEAMLAQMVRRYAEKMTPALPQLNAAAR
jgi:geranylgeranyl diphosphate synthase type II